MGEHHRLRHSQLIRWSELSGLLGRHGWGIRTISGDACQAALVPSGGASDYVVAILLGTQRVAAGPEGWGHTAEGGGNCFARAGEVNPFVARSRCWVGWCEFSAGLVKYFGWRCSTERAATLRRPAW
jgi:hypothetical protein